MPGFDLKMFGVEELQRAFVAAGAQVDAAAKANVIIGTAELIREAQSNFEGSHRKGEPHVGGAKPNVVTGNLRRSIIGQGVRHEAMGGYANTVGPTAKYGRRVELGMPGMGGAYPYFGPAAKAIRARMAGIAAANWAKFVKF